MMCFLALVLPSETMASLWPIMGGTIYLAMSFFFFANGFLSFLSSQVCLMLSIAYSAPLTPWLTRLEMRKSFVFSVCLQFQLRF